MDTFQCEVASRNMTGCLKCYNQQSSTEGLQQCQLCSSGYALNSTGQCAPIPPSHVSLTYFVQSTTSLFYKNYQQGPGSSSSSQSGCTVMSSFTNTSLIDPSVLSKAAPLLQYALRQVYLHESAAKSITATIYLTKGNHFFFLCSGDETDGQYSRIEYITIFRYCSEYNLYGYYYSANDNFDVTIAPLECSLGPQLGLTNDATFKSSCVDFSKGDQKPVVFVNNVNTYFNVTGKLTVKNIKFSGINALAQSLNKSTDLSIYPQLYCTVASDPQELLAPLSAQVQNTCLNQTIISTNVSCSDPLSGLLKKPPLPTENQTCTGPQFKQQQTSSLSCSGEPYSSDFFTMSSQGIYSKRRKTLFNIYAFAEHTTVRNATPELVLNESDFEYFLGVGYESLITVETNNLARTVTSVQQILTNDNANDSYVYTQSQYYYVYNGGDRGAKITISGSSFKYSRFCKGMIVYRPAFFDQSSSILNYTNLYMSNPIKQNRDSFVVLYNSSFTLMNVFTTTQALAITGQQVLTQALTTGYQQDSITYPTFVHKGIILNLEDFGGRIEVVGCTFSKNSHYIPSIFYTSISQAILSVEQFQDSSTTQELQFKICSKQNGGGSGTNAYFFGHSIPMTQLAGTDIDSLFDNYERLGLIYLSRNQAAMIFKGNTFQSNIGTFGGAITINSPNWEAGIQPYVVISANNFYSNMAYFSGNAIYIRNTLYKPQLSGSLVCAGVNLIGNNFINNFGMKVHNGGAVAAYCYYVTSTSHIDYGSLSQYNQPGFQGLSSSTISIPCTADNSQIQINQNIFNVQTNYFNENFSGGKGTALYIRQMSYILIKSCDFQGNSPVFAQPESQYSPYTLQFSGRSMSFYDQNCLDEFNYLQACKNSIDTSSYGGVQWSVVQGALSVIFCEDETCLNSNSTQILSITSSSFSQNLAGPVLDTSIKSTASQIQIQGGMQVSISLCSFTNNAGSTSLFANAAGSSLLSYFPNGYLSASMSPLLSILMNPPTKVNFPIQMNFKISQSVFSSNTNMQVLGLSSTQQYQGSLIQMMNVASDDPLYSQIITLTIDDSSFKDNQFTGPQSSLIYTSQILTNLYSNTFTNNGRITTNVKANSKSQASLYATSSQFAFKSYSYQDQQAYGCLTIAGSKSFGQPHQLMFNTISFSFAAQGAAFSFIGLDSQEVWTQGNSYQFLFAQTEGAIIYWQQNSIMASLQMQSEKASFIFSKINGAVRVYPIGLQTSNIIIKDSSFDNMNAQFGQALSFFQIGKVLVQNTNFTKETGLYKGIFDSFISSSFEFNKIALVGGLISSDLYSLFVSNFSSQEGFIDLQYVNNSASSASLSFNGKVFQTSTYPYYQYAEFINCNFLGNQASNYAGLYSYQSMVRIANTQGKYLIKNNLLRSQGVFGFEGGSQFILQNLNFKSNIATVKASAFYASSSDGFVSNCLFSGNRASQSGTVILQEDSNVSFDSCTFIGNWARDASTLLAQNNPDSQITFSNSVFVNNTAGSNLINLLYSNAKFGNCSFFDNIAQSVNHGITLINSQAALTRVTISYSQNDFLWKNNYTVDSGFFNLNYQSSMTVSNSTIKNCRGATAAVLYLTGSSFAAIGNNTLIQGSYSQTGDVVLATLAQQLVVDKTIFLSNGQTDIHVQQTPSTVTSSSFFNSTYNSITVNSASIRLDNNTFIHPVLDYSADKGKALYCECQGANIIANNSFVNLSAVQGGALFLLTSVRQPDSYFNLSNNIFEGNSAQQGGAIYLLDAVLLSMKGNLLKGNVAKGISGNNFAATLGVKGQGGALYYACEINGVVPASSPPYMTTCVTTIDSQNSFINNNADDGGAILWTRFRPNISSGTVFSGNQAYYGPDTGSFPKEIHMEFMSNNDYVNPYSSNGTLPNSTRRLQEVDSVPTLVSGNSMDFNLYILDQDGNVYKSDNSSKAVIQSTNTTGVILLNNQQIATDGVYSFRNVTLITQPGSTAPLQFSISGLPTFGNNVSFVDSPVSFKASVRTCVPGEQQTSDGQCQVCPAGSFQYFTPNSTLLCQTCPAQATCLGKADVAPLPGYWRSSNTSSTFVKCPNEGACLGGDTDNPNGKCFEGYDGIVCGDCSQNYYKPKEFTCQECPDPTSNLVQTVFILLAVVLYVAFLVRSTLASADKQKPVYAVYLKILTNHMQILSAISNIDYSWPAVIKDFQDKQQTVTSASNNVFSFDCFIMVNNGKTLPVFFQKLIMFGLLPILLFVVCFLFWAAVGLAQKKSLSEFRAKFISSLIIVLFLVHPNIAQNMFMTFNCLEVEGVYRMKQDIGTICYEGQHLYFISIVAFPAIGLWVIGIPLFALFVLMANKRVINLMAKKEITKAESEEINQLKLRYGFLFQGYNARTFYWEILIMYRKIFIIMTSVFLSTVSPEAQVLVVIFIIVINMFLQIKFEPFYTSTLNKMENYSMQVAALTVYVGMYYVTGTHYTYMQNQGISWFLLICIVVPNVFFLAYFIVNMRVEILKVVYMKKLNPLIFKLLACQSPEAFYEKEMRIEEEKAKETAQLIIEESSGNQKFESFETVLKDQKNKEDQSDSSFCDQKSSNTLDHFKSEGTSQTPRKGRNLRRASLFDDGALSHRSQIATSRSCKVHPESVATSRMNSYLEENAAAPEDVEVKYESDNKQDKPFTIDNEAILSKIAKKRKRRFEEDERINRYLEHEVEVEDIDMALREQGKQQTESESFSLPTIRTSSLSPRRHEEAGDDEGEKEKAGLGDTIMTFSKPLNQRRKRKRSNLIKRDQR